MLTFYRSRPIKGSLLQFFYQFVLTCGFAFSLYFIVTLLVEQKDFREEYFPFGVKYIEDLEQNNEYRIKAAKEYLQSVEISDFKPEINQPTELAITIVASYRYNQYYLTQTMGYLVKEIYAKQWKILICYVEEEENEEVQMLQSMGFAFSPVFENLTFAGSMQDQRVAKESNDYWKCLNQTRHSVQSDYVLMLEDDTLATPEATIQLQSIIEQLSGNERRQKVDYVKLFHPLHLRKLPSYIQIAFICLIVAVLPIVFFGAVCWNPTYCFNALLISFLFACMLVWHNPKLPSDIRFTLTGAAYMSYPESCCTPATLFRSQSIPVIVDRLIRVPSTEGYAKDHVLDESPFVGRMTDRSLFIHIGYVSSVRQTRVSIKQ